MKSYHVIIIGAGPAGLTAAYLLAKKGMSVCVLEADSDYVGGISRTVQYKGFYFDIGGHRFFSKSQAVEDFWEEILPRDLLERQRSSKIYYRGKLFSYPLKALEALNKLGIKESILCVASYVYARLFPIHPALSFEDWTRNQFGKRLFDIFFKTYTEKVWGMSCQDISADWAAQRIKNLSLGTAIWNACESGLLSFLKILKSRLGYPTIKRKGNSKFIKTLIESFRYPRRGPGMMWETCAEKYREMGGDLLMSARAVDYRYDVNTQEWTVSFKNLKASGPLQKIESLKASHVISSCPIRELGLGLRPHLSAESILASQSLRYRDFITVMIILKDQNRFKDNWIYIHDPKVKVGRIQNFKSWSPDMVPDPTLCSYGLEYFCFAHDSLWESTDEELLQLAKSELKQIGLADPSDILDGCVVRQPKAYPIYDDHYQIHVNTIRQEIATRFPNLHLIGRNGMHKYNNQDHAMMTAMLTVENITHGKTVYDVWKVNEDAEYHEASNSTVHRGSTGIRSVPTVRKAS